MAKKKVGMKYLLIFTLSLLLLVPAVSCFAQEGLGQQLKQKLEEFDQTYGDFSSLPKGPGWLTDLPFWAQALVVIFSPILFIGKYIPYYVSTLIYQIVLFGVLIAVSHNIARWFWIYLFLGTIAIYILQNNFEIIKI